MRSLGVPQLFAAVDLGASSARLFAGRLDGDQLEVREQARIPNGPVQLPDGIHWDFLRIHQGMLEALGQLSREVSPSPLWVGVDSWGVDYGLLDETGRLLGEPFHYRDERTAGRVEELDRLVGLEQLYNATGIQEMVINTVYQLLAERESISYAFASHLLMVPDLVAYLLTGERRLETTIASTTQLVDRANRGAGRLLVRAPSAPSGALCSTDPGRRALRPRPAGSGRQCWDRAPVSVVSVASHDTASAVLAVPALTEDFAYVASGTWSLVGLELDAPVITEPSRLANFSNELGYDGTVRFLKNVMGYWMLQECERTWARSGRPVRLVDLFDAAESCDPFRSLVDTFDPVFAVPGDMPGRVRDSCAASGEPVPETDAELVRCVLDSMALGICSALEEAQRCAGRRVSVLHVVGGGSAHRLFLSLIAACTGLEVVAGPIEASAVGNLLVQLRAAGLVGERPEMRALVGRSFPLLRVRPDPALAGAARGALSRREIVSAGE